MSIEHNHGEIERLLTDSALGTSQLWWLSSEPLSSPELAVSVQSFLWEMWGPAQSGVFFNDTEIISAHGALSFPVLRRRNAEGVPSTARSNPSNGCHQTQGCQKVINNRKAKLLFTLASCAERARPSLKMKKRLQKCHSLPLPTLVRCWKSYARASTESIFLDTCRKK